MQKGVADYFVQNYEKFFYSALKTTSSFEDAEDVMQDAFIRMNNAKEHMADNVVGAVKRHIKFAAADFYREYYGSRRKFKLDVVSLDKIIGEHRESENSESDFGMPQFVEEALGVEDLYDFDERELCSHVKDGEMFYLNAVEERTCEELAERYRMNPMTLGYHIRVAKEKLKKLLAA